MKTAVQRTTNVIKFSGSLAGGACLLGNAACSVGFARISGIGYTDASSVAASGLTFWQSADDGTNWDYVTPCALAACSACGAGFSIEVVGEAMKVEFRNGADDASNLRLNFNLRPI
jgi:hypothetical protein